MSGFYLHDDGYLEDGFADCLDNAIRFAKLVVDELEEAGEQLSEAESNVIQLYQENEYLKKEVERLKMLNDSLFKELKNGSSEVIDG